MSLLQKIQEAEIKENLKDKWHIPTLTGIIALAFILRYMPAKGMPYLQAADPYYIFRMSQHIALEGHLPQLDFMRYFPYATPNYTVQLGELLVPALLYNAGFSLFFENYLEWAQFYPAMMGTLTVLLMYFLGKELFNKKTGLAAAFFLTATSAALRRASAGFFEKEPLGTFLMILSLLFFTRAWQNESWTNGILSGLSLGLFTISWGGSQMLWLLYPILTGITLFLNIETRKLVTSYTPTILVAAGFAAASNPGRFWFTDTLFLISTAVLGTLWLRYLAEELNLIQEKYLSYFVPTLSVIGGIAAILSPLYSQWLAQKLIRLVNLATGNTGNSVIGQTVQENAAPGINSLATDLGSLLFGSINTGFDTLAILVSPWTFMLLSLTIITTTLLLMLGKRYKIIEETVPGKKYAAYTQTIFIGLMIAVTGLLLNQVVLTGLAALIITSSILTMNYYLDNDSAFTITSMFLTGLIVALTIITIQLRGSQAQAFAFLTILPTIAAILTSITYNYLDYFPEKTIEYNWILLIPLVWITSNIYGGTTRARLVFLSTFAVALAAGHGLTKTIEQLQKIKLPDLNTFKPNRIKTLSIILILGLTISLNLASALVMSQNITGSPSPDAPLSRNLQVWKPSIDYMSEETEPGDVVLSWWDYGYSFQTLGESAAQADGGNLRYYTTEGNHQNQFLSKYLNSTTANDTQFLEKHSADYIWLDNTMIGKFSPVSQIANNDNQEFESIARFRTTNARASISRDGNQTVITSRGRLRTDFKRRGRYLPVSGQLFIPIELTNSSSKINGPPTFRLSNGDTLKIPCTITEDGKTRHEISESETSIEETRYFDSGFCISKDPFFTIERGLAGGRTRFLAIPEKITDSTFVELYIQDGDNVEYAEKVPEASNGFIKMWEIQK